MLLYVIVTFPPTKINAFETWEAAATALQEKVRENGGTGLSAAVLDQCIIPWCPVHSEPVGLIDHLFDAHEVVVRTATRRLAQEYATREAQVHSDMGIGVHA